MMNNLEETDRKNLIIKINEEAKYLRGQEKKLQKVICLSNKKIHLSPENKDT